jgi:hypothetical protein
MAVKVPNKLSKGEGSDLFDFSSVERTAADDDENTFFAFGHCSSTGISWRVNPKTGSLHARFDREMRGWRVCRRE